MVTSANLTSRHSMPPWPRLRTWSLPTVIELLVATGLCESKGAARRAVQEGGAYLDNVRVLDPDTVPQATLAGGWVLLRKGKRNLAGVRLPAGS